MHSRMLVASASCRYTKCAANAPAAHHTTQDFTALSRELMQSSVLSKAAEQQQQQQQECTEARAAGTPAAVLDGLLQDGS